MHFSHRKERILSELIRADAFITGAHLAQLIGMSARTVREDIKALTLDLGRRDIALQSVPSKGYRISEGDRPTAKRYLDELSLEQSFRPTLPAERQQYILQQLLFSTPIMDELALQEKLFISESTLEKDLQEVMGWLHQNHLSLKRETDTEIRVEGPEIAFRYAMVNFFQEFMLTAGQIDPGELESILDIPIAEEVEEQLHRLHSSEFIHISQPAFLNILLYLAVAGSRLAKGHPVHVDPKEIPALASQEEFTIALNSLGEIGKTTGIRFPESEVIQFCKVLMQANIISVDQANLQATADDRTLAFVSQIVFKIQEIFSLDFTGDRKFINSLVLYLRSKVLDKGQPVMGSALRISEIEKEYPQALEITMLISSDLRKKLAIRLSEAEISELALFVCAAIERQKAPIRDLKVRVAIVCAAGKGSSQLLSVKMGRTFDDLEILGVFPSYRLSDVQAMNPDLIVSTVPLNVQGVDWIQISPLMTRDDELHVRSRIKAFRDRMIQRDRRALIDLFDEKLFFTDVEGNSVESVITWLGTQLYQAGFVDEAFTQSVLDREALYATSLGNLVAIPHAFLQHTRRPCIAVATLKEPIQWGSEKVQLVFLLNISTSQEADFKPLFEQLFLLINDRKKIQRLIKAANFTEVLKELNG